VFMPVPSVPQAARPQVAIVFAVLPPAVVNRPPTTITVARPGAVGSHRVTAWTTPFSPGSVILGFQPAEQGSAPRQKIGARMNNRKTPQQNLLTA